MSEDYPEDSNRLRLAGEVINELQTRTTPAGIPITRSTLEHTSLQFEAGHQRKVDCRIVVMALGKELHAKLNGLGKGVEVKVEGFICYESSQKMETRLTLHALDINRI